MFLGRRSPCHLKKRLFFRASQFGYLHYRSKRMIFGKIDINQRIHTIISTYQICMKFVFMEKQKTTKTISKKTV